MVVCLQAFSKPDPCTSNSVKLARGLPWVLAVNALAKLRNLSAVRSQPKTLVWRFPVAFYEEMSYLPSSVSHEPRHQTMIGLHFCSVYVLQSCPQHTDLSVHLLIRAFNAARARARPNWRMNNRRTALPSARNHVGQCFRWSLLVNQYNDIRPSNVLHACQSHCHRIVLFSFMDHCRIECPRLLIEAIQHTVHLSVRAVLAAM